MKRILFLIFCSLFMASCVSQEELLRRQQENEKFIQENIDEIDRKLIEETEPYEVLKTIDKTVLHDLCGCDGNHGREYFCKMGITGFLESIQDNLIKISSFEPKWDYGLQVNSKEEKGRLHGGLCNYAKDQILFKVAKKMLRKDIANDELFFKCIVGNYYTSNTDECIIYRRNSNIATYKDDYTGQIKPKERSKLVDYKKYFPSVKTDNEFSGLVEFFHEVESIINGSKCENKRFHNGNIPTSTEIQECKTKSINVFNSYVKGTLPSCKKMYQQEWTKFLQSIKTSYKSYYWENKKGLTKSVRNYKNTKEFDKENSLAILYFIDKHDPAVRGYGIYWLDDVHYFMLDHSCKPDMNDIVNIIVND